MFEVEAEDLAAQPPPSSRKDDFAVGTVLMFERRFSEGGPAFTYVAIKAPSGWYFSGRGNSEAKTWRQVLSVLDSDSVERVLMVSEWTEVEL